MFRKPRLTLPIESEKRFASWTNTLHRMLAESGVFTVDYADLPRLPRSAGGRWRGCLSTVKIGEALVAIDAWDTDDPSATAYKEGHFNPGGCLGDVRLVLKIQWQPAQVWSDFMRDTMIPIVPWTIFPSREFPLGAFQYDPTAKHIYTGAITGVMRYGRGPFRDAVVNEQDFYARLGSKDDPIESFVNICRTCRWGISLKGKRGTDGKNRREIEFASCGMPLALNYEPHYPFQFEAGRDFVLLKEPADLLKLRTIDPKPFAKRAADIYRDYWSPRGMARLAVDLVREHCGAAGKAV